MVREQARAKLSLSWDQLYKLKEAKLQDPITCNIEVGINDVKVSETSMCPSVTQSKYQNQKKNDRNSICICSWKMFLCSPVLKLGVTAA